MVISGRGVEGKSAGWVGFGDRIYGFCGFVTCSDGSWRLSDGFGASGPDLKKVIKKR